MDWGRHQLTHALPVSSPHRFDCPHAAACGGCPLIDLTYDDQLAQKRERVAVAVRAYPALAREPVLPVVAASSPVGYRTRAKLMVAPGGRVGLFSRDGQHTVIDTPGCLVLAPVLVRTTAALRRAVIRDEEGGVSGALTPAARRGAPGLVAFDMREVIAVEGGEARVLVTFVVARGSATKLESLRAAATALMVDEPAVAGVAVNFNDGEGPQVLGAETLLLAGERSLPDSLGRSIHRATFGSFVQAHRGQAARLHEEVARAVFRGRDTPRVLDLYGGSGAIALSLAARGALVRLVESFGPAVEQAAQSARAAGVPLRVEHADVRDALARMARGRELVDVAVVNPPRRGLDPEVRAQLAALDAETVVYVSCQPETLARDLAHLQRLGLALETACPIDMIPLTEEVETVAVLCRSPAPAPVVLYEDAEVVIVDKSPHEPTTPQGESDRELSLLRRVQRRTGSADAAAVHRLDIGTSGVVVFVRHSGRAAAWADAMGGASARKIYTVAVRGRPPSEGVIDRSLVIDGRAKDAQTTFQRLALYGAHALVDVEPLQGRTHQIRRHLAGLGHPVLGDTRYGHEPTNRFVREKHGLDRTFLHARRLELVHPSTGRRLVIEAPLPGDLTSALRSLEATPLPLERDAALVGHGPRAQPRRPWKRSRR